MDFDIAARRLQEDQSKLRRRKAGSSSSSSSSSTGGIVSAKAKREAVYRKQQQERLRREREQKRKQQDYQRKYFIECERALGVRSLGRGGGDAVDNENNRSTVLKLMPTSIHGDGDKIALPPSILERLSSDMDFMSSTSSSPWTFRVALAKVDYTFPSSDEIRAMSPPDEDDDDDEDDMDVDEDDDSNNRRAAYMAELHHKYHSYSHGTVVEFTQDEGHIGIPAAMAKVLLSSSSSSSSSETIPITRTKDPAGAGDNINNDDEDDETEKTPGHLAWGAFDVPAVPVEVSLVRLPKGKNCTLLPTEEAIKSGFYNLNNIKLVLEQSLSRTRSTLSVGDTIHTWHRGVKYDLVVQTLSPPDFGAVSCINTDIEVDFAPLKTEEEEAAMKGAEDASTSTRMPVGGTTLGSGHTLGTGYRLSDALTTPPLTTTTAPAKTVQATSGDLPPEPPMDLVEGVCMVQIRGTGGISGRRRMDIHATTMSNLFTFATSLLLPTGEDPVAAAAAASSIRLATRFPRRVFEDPTSTQTLSEAGIQSRQELLFIEQL